jgi:tRNA G18 (ribose-2'-O)-methylase SpoU
MPQIIEISSTDDPRIADYVGVREAELRRDRYDAPGGLFIAEGELVFRRLLASRYATRSVLLTPTRLATVRDAVETLAADVPVYLVEQKLMNSVVGFNIHRGLLALGVRGPEPDLGELLTGLSCVVVLEDLVNHDNIGGIFRNVAALAGVGPGGGGVLLSLRCSDPLYRKAIRVSIGWALAVPFARMTSWRSGVEKLREAGFVVVGLHPGAQSVDLSGFCAKLARNRQRVALVVGTEGPGLTDDAIQSMDKCVRIPMRGDVVDSLNASVATAIALHRITEILP